MRITAHRTALAALVAGLILAACGGGGTDTADSSAGSDGSSAAAPNGGQSVTIIAKEFVFEPESFTVPAGTVSFTVDNQGVVEHDFTVDELDMEVYAEPGTQATEEVTFETGTYTFYCSIPGHRESGMEGTLTVD